MIPSLAHRLLTAASALFMTGLLPACGQEKEPAPARPALTEAQERTLLQELFEAETSEALAAKIAAAEKAGIAKQAILEARFLFLVDQQDFAAVAAMAPTLREQKKSFRIEDSEIFNVPEEFYAIVEYSQALGALEEGDQAGFKKHITEAFWLSPRQATAFGPHIERLRLELAMAKVRIDFKQEFRQQADMKKVALSSLAKNSEHVLLHFWSPWSAECEANLPDFIAMARELATHEIAVVSVLIQSDQETLTAANTFRAEINEETPGAWIVDNFKPALNQTLRVLDLPTVALLSVEGAVLYNGHPSDEALWNELRKVAPEVQRPPLVPVE